MSNNEQIPDGPAAVFVGQLTYNGPLLEYWEKVLRREYGRGYKHGYEQANKEVPNENPLPIPAADNC